MTSDCSGPTEICDIYGECVPNGSGSGATQYTLTVQIAGSGAGEVTSMPAGITCSAGTCSGLFDAGTEVTLTQMTSAGAFLGWTSGCKGTGACSVTLSSEQRVGALFGIKGEVLWAKRVGAEGYDWGHGVVTTKDGDVVAVGQFAGTMSLDAFMLQSGGADINSAYVAKFDGMTGKTIWAASLPVDNAYGVATDGDALYVTGTFVGTAQLGNSALSSAGGEDVFIAKLDDHGAPQWAVSFGGIGTDLPYGLAVANGTVAVIGHETAGIKIGSMSYPASGAALNGFVAAVDSTNGMVKWSHVLTATGVETDVQSVFAGSKLLVGGYFGGAVDFGAGSVIPAGSDAFVAQYDFDTGLLAQLDHWGTSGGSADVSALSQDTAGNIVAAAQFSGALTIYGITFTATGDVDVFGVSYKGTTNNWEEWWSGTAGTIAYPTSLSIGLNDLVIVGNFCKGTASIGRTQLTGVLCTNQNLLRTGAYERMRPDGYTYLGVHSLGLYGWTDAVTRPQDDRVFVTGKFTGALRLDTTVLLATPVGEHDAYVLGFAP